VPSNWKRISAIPVRKVRGMVIGERNTLDFLLSTQNYIAKIRTPVAPHPGIRVADYRPAATARPLVQGKKRQKLVRTLSEFIERKAGKLRVIPANSDWETGSGYTSLPVSPRSTVPISPQTSQFSIKTPLPGPISLAHDYNPLALSARIGLLKRRCQSPENGYIRLSKTAGTRRKRPIVPKQIEN
jgi:hypothetical protein